MFRWVELAYDTSKAHLPFLSDFLREAGVENELTSVATSPENWQNDLQECREKYNQIRFGRQISESISTQNGNQVYFGREFQWAECLVLEDGSWWPRSYLKDAILVELSRLKANLDYRKRAIVIGANGQSSVAVRALAQYGFRQICIVDPDQDAGEEFTENLSKVFFDQDITYQTLQEITLASADSSVVINCYPSGRNDSFINDLCFFNYLSTGGLVVDLNLHPVDSTLVSEARKVGIRAMPGYLIWGRLDGLWIRDLIYSKFRIEEYQIRLRLVCSRSTSA